MDAGRIINPLAGRSQIEGAIVMGIGMALLGHTSYDRRSRSTATWPTTLSR
jgi:xanthine dehydrogenase YagR molybdenum-binding subunit